MLRSCLITTLLLHEEGQRFHLFANPPRPHSVDL